MPCSPLSNHCHGGIRFHPYLRMHGVPPCLRNADMMQGDELPSNQSRWYESDDDQYTFEMDVPGVLLPHVTIEETNGEIEVTAIRYDPSSGDVVHTHQDILYISPTKSDLSKATVTLVDGVLKLVVPKTKLAAPLPIAVEAMAPPVETTVPGLFYTWTMDLPGVHASDIDLQVRQEGRVIIRATRHLGERVKLFHQVWDVSALPSDAVREARAFLQDGVLALVIARVRAGEDKTEEQADSEEKPAATRTIVVTAGDADKVEQNEMVVETVDEWEQVDEESKKKAAENI